MEQETEYLRSAQYQNLLRLIESQKPAPESAEPPLAAAGMRSIVNCHRLGEAYKETARIAYVSEQFPAEIVYAADTMPWNIESLSIMLSQSVDVNRIFQLTQEHELSRDICSFLRGPIGLMLDNSYPRPDVVLTNDQPCEGLHKTIFMAGKRYDAPVIALHTPNGIDDTALDYLEEQLDGMLRGIFDAVKAPYDPAGLAKAVKHSNDARTYYTKTAELLKTHRLPGVGRELQEIFGMNVFGSPENVEICKVLFEEAETLSKIDRPRKPRILWIGQSPEDSDALIRHIEETVDVIYWSSVWDANFIMLDEDRPLRGIAERAIRYHWNADRMEADIDGICDDFGIDALVIANTWGCRNVLGVSPVLRSLAERKKLRHLSISIDPIDENNYVFTHIKNRVDAFLETLM